MKEIENFKVDEILIRLFVPDDEEIPLLLESRQKGRILVGTYSYDIHMGHNSTGEYHLVLYDKGREILAINKISGTAHDGYHGVRIPNKAFDVLKKKFSDWKWPENQILESTQYTYLLDKKDNSYLRPVKVFEHRNYDNLEIRMCVGFFHRFGDDPFLTGGAGGWKERTVALIENEDGIVMKVPIGSFKFLDFGK